MSARSQPKNLAEALKRLPASFEDAGQALTALRDQSQRFCGGCEALAKARREAAKSLAGELATVGASGRRAAGEIKAGDQDLVHRVDPLRQSRAESLSRFSAGATKLVEWVNASGESAGRGLAELDRKLGEIGALAGRRRQELLRHLGRSAACLGLMDHGQREFHGGLSQLQNQFAEHVEIRSQRRLADGRAEALRAAEAGVRAMQSGDLAHAEPCLRRAHALLPSPATVFNLALVLILAGKVEEAHALLHDPALSQCDPVEAQALKSLQALHARNFPAALREAEAGLQLRPDHPVLRSLAATAALQTSSPAAAFVHLPDPHAALQGRAFARTEPDSGEPLFTAEQLDAAGAANSCSTAHAAGGA